MGGLSDTLLARGCASHIEVIHGEAVEILSGPDAGKKFAGVVEVLPDLILEGELGGDPRSKTVVRFRNESVPNLASQGQVKTADGRKWNAIRQDFGSFLTTDFELKEIVPGLDT